MKVWIDITSLPHAHFMREFIKGLLKRGDEPLVTTRKFGVITEILDSCGIAYTVVGSHGISKEEKIVKSSERIIELSKLIAKERPDAGLSKHSVECARVCFGFDIPSILVADHETAKFAMRLMVPLSDYTVTPKATPEKDIRSFGAKNIRTFFGVCEKAHFYNFTPDSRVLEKINASRNDKIIVARPEPMLSSHNYGKSHLYDALSGILSERNDVRVVLIPRGEADRKLFSSLDVTIPDECIDTLSLFCLSRLMLGAGSCMNREACMAGCNTISICPDFLPAVDKFLIEKGLMNHSADKDATIRMANEALDAKRPREREKKIIERFDDPYAPINSILGELV